MSKLKTTSYLKDHGSFKAESVPKLIVFMEREKWLHLQPENQTLADKSPSGFALNEMCVL